MAVFRVNRNKNYTHMANYHFRDTKLSWKAKGILSNMLSLPDDWDYSLAGLATLASDGMSATRSAIKELEAHGYLIRRPIRKDGKIADWEYLIFERPHVGNLVAENQQVENSTQLSTKESSTKKSSTKEINIYPFDEFWAAYPKKKAKEDARKAWAKLKPDEELGKVILQAVESAKRSQDWTKDKGKYIPYPATYLNGKRWEDERNDTHGTATENPPAVRYGKWL